MGALRFQATVWTGGGAFRLDEVSDPARAEVERAFDRGRASGKFVLEGVGYRWGKPTDLTGRFPILDSRAYGVEERDSGLPGWMRTPTGA